MGCLETLCAKNRYRIARNIGVVQIWRIDQKMYLVIKNLTTPQIARGHAYIIKHPVDLEYQCSASFEATVRGLLYHINQSVSGAAAGEQLNCIREGGNRLEDKFAVAVVKVLSKRSGYSPNELCMDHALCLKVLLDQETAASTILWLAS